MMNLIKKDFLLISRNRSELLTLLGMPMILIAILGFALSGLLSGTSSINAIPIAFVNENHVETDIQQFKEHLTQQGYPHEQIEMLGIQAQSIDPANMIITILEQLQDEKIVSLALLDASEAQQALKNETVSAVLTLPEAFTFNSLMALFQNETPNSVIDIVAIDVDSISATVLESVITRFSAQYNLDASILSQTQGTPVYVELPDNFGETTYLPQLKSVTSFQYYTIGMTMMFSLYIASSISSNAFIEKSNHTFSRIMITGEKPIRYLLSKGIAAMLISLVQILLLFGASALLFQTFGSLTKDALKDIFLISLVLSSTIGALSILLTSLSQRFNTDSVSGVFSSFIVTAFSFIGGNTIPMNQFSPFMREIGQWTPNGAMMNAYLKLMQGQALSDVMPLILRMGLMIVLFMVVALYIFPRRRLV